MYNLSSIYLSRINFKKVSQVFLISLTNLFDVYGANFNFETKDSRRGYKFEKRGKYKSM